MLKKYKSKMTALRILVKVGDNIVPVEFGWDLIYANSGIRGCSFSTDDVELQKALEKHEYFNRALQPSFWTDDKEEEAPIPDDVVNDGVNNGVDDSTNDVNDDVIETVTEFPEVTTMADARRILKEVFGKTAKETKSNAQVLALANELNIKFPNLK
ncbi:MAG: hypothetical protein E7075_00350 [Bacteroidales bacterium]|nr:hypothetical protein [Bacteroidales bacterium]